MSQVIVLRRPDGLTLEIEPNDSPGESSLAMMKDGNGKLLQIDLINNVAEEIRKQERQGFVEGEKG
jgi:hypothetical protein